MASRYSADVLAGRYRLDAFIGSGGAADVHRGLDLRLRRPVAVKVFRPGAGVDMEERFQSEAVILARLQHPGLVTVYDTGRHHDRAYLVMQLIEGPTLKGRIAKGPLSPDETAALGAGLAAALAHTHEAGIVHRDVKPSNIILDESGRPHLTDFGISRLLDGTTHTATGTLIGTAAYLSPEQVLGRPVGQAVDVYALGLVLLECLTGRLEYGGGPLEAAIARLHRQPVLPDSLPKDFAALLRHMTALEEWNRPPAHECARILTSLAGTARSASVPSVTQATSFTPIRKPARDAEPTHLNPLPAVSATERKTAAPRRRALFASGTAALAAVLTTAVAVSDGPSRNDATPVAPSSSIPDTPAEPHRDAPAVRSPRSAPADPSRSAATEAAAHRTAAPTLHPGSDGTEGRLTTDSSHTGNGTRTRAPGEQHAKSETARKNQGKGQKGGSKER
ncbi:protein kinase [Streptomyces marokkonensis]|uniref:non-specific serine/threonine protein kinase n=1 Tax=Streptomyces marokkonensis TaxID=324855 RepID=A0ABW6Q9D6_9ACTN